MAATCLFNGGNENEKTRERGNDVLIARVHVVLVQVEIWNNLRTVTPHRLRRHEADNPFSRFPLWKNALFPYVLRAQSVSPPKYVAVYCTHIIQLNEMVQPGSNGYTMALDRN